jgi:predicted O-methyltransferase YrrM
MITISYDEFKNKYGTIQRTEDYHPREVSYDIIATLMNYYKPKNILEIGTQFGGGTIILAMYSDGHVYTIDIPREFYPELSSKIIDPNDRMKFIELGNRIKDHPNLFEHITQIYGDSQNFDYSVLPKFDFVFIDGNHTKEAVITDTLKALERLNFGGIIFWHDIQIPVVAEGINYFDGKYDIITVEGQNATFMIWWKT